MHGPCHLNIYMNVIFIYFILVSNFSICVYDFKNYFILFYLRSCKLNAHICPSLLLCQLI